MAELHRRWLAAVLSADPDLQLGAGLPPTFNPNPHEFAHTVPVDRGKRILFQNPFRQIRWENLVDIVA
jgi:hypothetical protein